MSHSFDDDVSQGWRMTLTDDEYHQARSLVAQPPRSLSELGINSNDILPWDKPDALGDGVQVVAEPGVDQATDARVTPSTELLRFISNPRAQYSSENFLFAHRYVRMWRELRYRVRMYERERRQGASSGGSGGPTTASEEDTMVDPTFIMTAIGSGLSLVDKFVDLVRNIRSGDDRPHRVEAKQEGGSLMIRRDGQVVETVNAQQLHLNEWDSTRFNALRERAGSLWNQFNGLYGQLPSLSVDEQVRIKQLMESMRRELCRDFREMVEISEKVLGVPLDDHYTLYSTCHEGMN